MFLQLDGISKSFGKKEVLKDISFSFEQGKIYAILGRNGVGKTTLFNCICGNLQADQGKCYIITNENEAKEIDYKDIGMVSAAPVLPEFLTGYEYSKFYLEVNGFEYSRQLILDYFALIRLCEEDQHRLIKEYSFGMKNKLQLLCSLITRPSVILLDEPLTSLDIIVSHDIKELIIAMKKDHIILMSTHILQLARDVCDEIVILDNCSIHQTTHIEKNDQEFESQIIKELQDQ